MSLMAASVGKAASGILEKDNFRMKKFAMALLAVVAILSVGAYFYVDHLERRHAEQAATLNLQLKKVAKVVSQKTELWRKQALDLAQDPSLIESLNAGDSALKAWLLKYAQVNDEVSALRVLRPDLMRIDNSQKPPLGYAGLDLLRRAASSKKIQMPEIHMLKSEDKHIALAAPVVLDGQAVAVALLTIKLSALEKGFNKAIAIEPTAFFKLKQGSLPVLTGGVKPRSFSKPISSLAVPKTRWKVSIYKQLEVSSFSYLELQSYILVLAIVILMLVMLFGVLRNKDKRQLIWQKYQRTKPAKKVKTTLEPNPHQEELDLKKQADADLADSIKEKVGAHTEQIANPVFMKEGAIEVTSQQDVPQSIFRAYDIRGIVDESLTEQGVLMIGRAIASEALAAGQDTLVVARDGRLHSARLSESLVKGILSCGCDVIDIGQVPTPYCILRHIRSAPSRESW